MQRMTFGGFDVSVIDPHVRDTQYIWDEIFVAGIYRHPKMKIPAGATLMNVGANIGLFDLWAHREYRPAATSTPTRPAPRPTATFRTT